MKRRFNYTGRIRIPRERITVTLNRSGNSISSFNANVDLNGLHLQPDARVYIEAYHRTDSRRFNFGTVGNLTSPRDTTLTSLAYIENLKFRVLVVDETGQRQHGLILAHADRIRPISEVGKTPILPVEFRDLGQQIWRVEYGGDEGSPVLILNRKIPNIENTAKSDPQFIMFIYPAVIREVLTHIIFVDGVDSSSEPSTDWHGDWLDFARSILPGEGPPEILNRRDSDFQSEDVEKWIDKVVEEFCVSRSEWSEYIRQLTGGEE